MREAARALVNSDPDVVVVVSPHTPRLRQGWGVVTGDRLWGDFRDFRAPNVGLELPIATAGVDRLLAVAEHLELPLWPLQGRRLDHGALVPLHFAVAAGWTGPTVLIALPWPGPADDTEALMGEAIAAAAGDERWAVLASGDMSHRLKPGAPAGFHPRAKEFDARLVELVTAGDYRAAARIDPALRELAAEDAVQSIAVAAAACQWRNDGHRTLNYEGPFGVGYMQAILHTESRTAREA